MKARGRESCDHLEVMWSVTPGSGFVLLWDWLRPTRPRDIYQGCSVNIIYLLTEWKGQTGKCLARGHDVPHGRSNPVNNYFILWLSAISYFSDFAPAAFLGAMRVIYVSLYYGPAKSWRSSSIRSFFSYRASALYGWYDKTGLVLVLSLVSFSLAWGLRAYTKLMQEKNYDSKMDVRIN